MNVRRFLPWLLWACLLGRGEAVRAQESVESLTAAFIYQFTKYIEWPSGSDPNSPFVINVINRESLNQPIQKLLLQRRIKNRPVRIISDSEDSKADLIVIGDSPDHPAEKMIGRVQGCKCLLVNLSSKRIGAVINLYVKDENMAFDISQPEAKRNGLYVSARLLNLAHRVIAGE